MVNGVSLPTMELPGGGTVLASKILALKDAMKKDGRLSGDIGRLKINPQIQLTGASIKLLCEHGLMVGNTVDPDVVRIVRATYDDNGPAAIWRPPIGG